MNLSLAVQVACEAENLPKERDFRRWTLAALRAYRERVELTIRVVTEAESQRLNRDFRGYDRPTNVLSFPSDLPRELALPLIGDLVICAPVVEREAAEQNKQRDAHWAHMVVHGILHLVGFDHARDEDARRMEQAEAAILGGLGFADPYV